MTRGQKRSLVRRGHSWLGWAASILLVVVAASGIALQHPRWLGSPPNEPLCLSVDPADSLHILRGTHWGVEASTDGGLHWQEVPMLAAPTDVARILFVSGITGDEVYALGQESMVASADGGRVWREVAGPTDERAWGAHYLDLSVSPAGSLDLLTTAGQYRRDPAGNWSAVGPELIATRDWHRWLHDLHTGHVFGLMGRRAAEAGAWGLILLTVTGLVLHRRAGRRP
jgi:hypothetical protein